MALYVYTDESEVPVGIKVVNFNDTYFDTFTTIENSDLVKDILSTVDKAEFNSINSFVGRTKSLGALNKSMLSTGTKTLLNIIQHPDVCFNSCECGANALEFLPSITEGKVIWRVPVLSLIGNYKCNIVLNGKKVFVNFHDLQKYVIDRRGKDL